MLKYEKDYEKKKFREMNIKEKIQHIKEYYIWHIIGGIIGLSFIIGMLNLYIINPPAKPSVNIAVVGQYLDYDQIDLFKAELDGKFPEFISDVRRKKKEIVVTPIYFGNEKSNAQAYAGAVQKTMAMVSAGEIDIMIGDKTMMESYARQHFFFNLKELLGVEDYNKIEDRVIMIQPRLSELNDDGKVNKGSQPLLINISSYLSLKGAVTGEEVYMAVVANTQRKENTLTILDYIIKK